MVPLFWFLSDLDLATWTNQTAAFRMAKGKILTTLFFQRAFGFCEVPK